MKNILLILILSIICCSCNKKKYFDGPNYFKDEFETYTSLNDLLLDDDKLWSFTQLTKEANNITVDTTNVHSGKKSLKFVAKKSDSNVLSKCAINKQNMAFWEGETLKITVWYFIEGTSALDWLFLVDIEDQAAIGAGPGMRLALVDNQLRVEYKFNEDDILQNIPQKVDFPRNKWVELIWEVKLSRKNKGSVKLWQDGQLIIDSKNNRTLPKDILYFQQGTLGRCSSIEIGVTANTKDNDLIMWADDIKFEKSN